MSLDQFLTSALSSALRSGSAAMIEDFLTKLPDAQLESVRKIVEKIQKQRGIVVQSK